MPTAATLFSECEARRQCRCELELEYETGGDLRAVLVSRKVTRPDHVGAKPESQALNRRVKINSAAYFIRQRLLFPEWCLRGEVGAAEERVRPHLDPSWRLPSKPRA